MYTNMYTYRHVDVHICVCILSMSTTTKGLRGWHIVLTAFTVCVRNTISPCILVTTLCTLCILFVNVHLATTLFLAHIPCRRINGNFLFFISIFVRS